MPSVPRTAPSVRPRPLASVASSPPYSFRRQLFFRSPPPCTSILSPSPPAMARHTAGRVLLALLVALLVATAAAESTGADRVEGERQVWRVVMEHLNALNACSLRRLMAQHPYVSRRQEGSRDQERRDNGALASRSPSCWGELKVSVRCSGFALG